MKHWEYGIDNLWLTEQPWWLTAVGFVADRLDFAWLYRVPIYDPGKTYWYDNTLGDWVFYHLSCPLLDWVDQHPRRKLYRVPVDPGLLRELFYGECPLYFDAL